MRKYLFFLAMVGTAAFASCGGDDNDDKPVTQITISSQPESLSAGAEGGTFTINVSTTGKEWSSYSNEDWIEVVNKGTTSASGIAEVTVKANPTTKSRNGRVHLMSGTARKEI
ncbi:MAG: BACON domain-containing protein, partial [Prevotella sp.]|nr:BACON domain-containing protein [Prevotella sp.]